MRVASTLGALVLAIGSSLTAARTDPRPPARLGSIGGHSGKLVALVETREGLSELVRAGLAASLREPGVYPVAWPASWPARRSTLGASVILLTRFSAKRDGRIGQYVLGIWPNEGGSTPASPAARYAAARPVYAVPRGFIKVTKETARTRVSEHFRLGDFLTKDQPDVWPKYLVLDLKLVDELELVIGALHEAGHPVRGLHVMSGFRTPTYNARDVGPGRRSAISRHLYGDAADVYPDDDGDGRLDDLNGDGHVDVADARIVAEAATRVESAHPDLQGGIAVYPETSAHGPFVHVDTRGRRAAW